eukprot:TRINITY_DN23744_c0_g1_i1.p1 TRINITY_DN23744_c0_g1~~TRINITY_DN23744_c0_g1_i1.p1  ORF type:complete len:180 (-),score=19.09 TRINITY_DN23744_c0_g1_i1:24-563(-)
MIRRPPRSTQGVSSAASDVYKRQPIEFILNSSCSKCNEKKTTLVQRITSCGCTFDICKYCFLGEMKNNLCPKCQAPLKPQAVHLLTHGLCIECKKHLEILPCGHYIDRLCLREKMLDAVKQQQGFDHIQCKEDKVPIPYELLVKVGEDLITELSIYQNCLLYTSPSPRDLSTSRMPSSA